MGTKFRLARLFAPGLAARRRARHRSKLRGHQHRSPAPVERHPGARSEVAARGDHGHEAPACALVCARVGRAAACPAPVKASRTPASQPGSGRAPSRCAVRGRGSRRPWARSSGLRACLRPGWPRGGVPGTGQSFAGTSITARLRSSATQARGPRSPPADTMGTKSRFSRLDFAPGSAAQPARPMPATAWRRSASQPGAGRAPLRFPIRGHGPLIWGQRAWNALQRLLAGAP